MSGDGKGKGSAIDHAESGESAPPKRRRGRPRDPGADRRILTAARAVAGDVGVQGSSMSAIADRSGVGKPTIYLRWANRHELMIAALADLRGAVVTEHTGSTRADLLRSLQEDRETLVTGEDARFLRSVLFETETDADLAQELETAILGPRRERLVAMGRHGNPGIRTHGRMRIFYIGIERHTGRALDHQQQAGAPDRRQQLCPRGQQTSDGSPLLTLGGGGCIDLGDQASNMRRTLIALGQHTDHRLRPPLGGTQCCAGRQQIEYLA